MEKSKEITIEEEKMIHLLIQAGNGYLFSLSERKMIFNFAKDYAASLNRQGWTRVETELPEVGITVLVYFLGHIYESKLLEAKKSYLSDYSIGNKFYKWDYFTNGCRSYNVTHWMPLPNKPI